MPFVAHDDTWILGYGDTPDEALQRMRIFHPDAEASTSPATQALVSSIADDTYRPRLEGDPIPAELYHIGSIVDGVQMLAEEFLAFRDQTDRDGFAWREVQEEVVTLRAAALRERFGGTWGEHPDWPVNDWHQEVANGDTRLGYWEWVAARLEQSD